MNIPFRKLDKLDILIPVYNEGSNIVEVLTSLHKQVKTPYRILICYDNENDNTLAALTEYSYPTEITLVKNTGQGVLGAIQSGFDMSNTDALIIFPADDKFNAGIIDSMVRLFEEGCEIVAASRLIPGGCMVGCPWLKSTLVRTAAALLYRYAHLPTHDPTNGFRLFSRRVLNHFAIESPQGWSFSLELLVKCHRAGWRVEEVSAEWHERAGTKSRFQVFKWLPDYLKWFFYAFQTRRQKEIKAIR